MLPVKISVKDKSVLYVKWDDDSKTIVKLTDLRRKCPCAICGADSDKRGEKYIPIYSKQQMTLVKISAVGSYAVGVEWEDGHNTGIYDFSYLRKISDILEEA